MIRCPGDERLAQLLEERLDRRELAEVERHLERCGQCQEALEELTRERFSFVEWLAWAEESGVALRRPGLVDARPRPGRGRRPDPPTLPSLSSSTLPSLDAEPDFRDWGCPVVEGYEILGRLGQGGMGVVYRARQHGLERLVALKMIRAGSHAAPEHLVRFRIEALAVARLRHPNVVQVYDIGQAEGLPFVALELLEGGSLESRIAGTPQPERDSAELMVTLAGAVAAAHRAGVAHRDLKSANVLFDLDGVPKVTDFGLAKRLDEDDGQTHSGQVMGSPSFMAPEQAMGQGRVVGPAADLYSLGAILYEMLTGRPPFKGASAMETLFQVVHDEPVPLTSLRPGLSRDLETICLKCLAKEPHRRYESAEALAEDLRRFLDGSPIQARRTGPRERLWKWARRQPAAATLAAFAILVLAGLIAGGIRGGPERGPGPPGRAGPPRGRQGPGRGPAGAPRSRLGRRPEAAPRVPRPDPATGPAWRTSATGPASSWRRWRPGRDEQDRIDAARRSLEQFRRLRDEAQLRDTQFTGVGQLRDLGATRRAARAALDAFASPRPDGEWAPAEIPASLSPRERDEVEQGRYELLLIWADAVAQPAPGEDPRRQAEQALRILDRAARLHAPTRAYHLLRASFLTRLGDAIGADRERRIAESIPAVDAFGHVLQGQLLYHQRNWPAAIAEFEEALRAEPGQFRAQLLLAVCQLQAQHPDAARANLTACLQREPGAISLYMLRGFAYGEEGYEKLRQARESTPRPPSLVNEANGLFDSAEADFRTALAMNPDVDERYGLLVNRGALRIRTQRLDEAVADLSQAVALKPGQVAAYITLGQAYRLQGRVDEAIEQFTLGIALKPDMPALYRSRALARLDRGRSRGGPEARDLALDDLSEAIRLGRPGDPEFAADRARRARLLHQAGRHQEALADAEDALRAAPDDPDALVLRVKSLQELKRFDEVIGACDDALARGRPSAELLELRGLAKAGREEYSGAIQDYTQALALEPGRPKPLIHRGWAYTVSGAPKLALADFDEAIRIAPDEPDAYNGRGFARVLHGQHKLAVADAEESLRHGPADHRTAYNAARIYAKAAEAAIAEAPRGGRGLLRQAEDYQDSAQALIRLAIERLPEDRRAAFWRDVVQPDPALAAVRQRPKFSQLAGQYGRMAK